MQSIAISGKFSPGKYVSGSTEGSSYLQFLIGVEGKRKFEGLGVRYLRAKIFGKAAAELNSEIDLYKDELVIVKGKLTVQRNDQEGRFYVVEAREVLHVLLQDSVAVDPAFSMVTLAGRLGKDPEPRYYDNGDVRTELNVITNPAKNVVNGFYLSVWGKPAENIASHAVQGCTVEVVGSLEWSEKDGKTYWNLRGDEAGILSWPRRKEEEAVRGADSVSTGEPVESNVDPSMPDW